MFYQYTVLQAFHELESIHAQVIAIKAGDEQVTQQPYVDSYIVILPPVAGIVAPEM